MTRHPKDDRPGVGRGVLIWVGGSLALIILAALIGCMIGLWRTW